VTPADQESQARQQDLLTLCLAAVVKYDVAHAAVFGTVESQGVTAPSS
jgi:hypothetical protein